MTEDRSWSDVSASSDLEDDEATREVEAIEAGIEETRIEMTETVDAIGAKLSPANIVQGAKDTVREATVGKVEQMANTAGQMVEEAGTTAQQAGAGIVETIRRNPVPAAMVGLGLGMLWRQRNTSSSGGNWSSQGWNRGYGTSAYGSTGYGSTGYGSTGYAASGYGSTGYGSAGGGGTPLPERVGQTAGEAVDNVRQFAGDAASTVGQTGGQVVQNVQQTGEQVVQNVQQTGGQVARQVEQMVQENPLAVGAVALAVGTALGMALPSTRMEQRTLGQAGERLIQGAESAIEQPLQKMEEQAQQA